MTTSLVLFSVFAMRYGFLDKESLTIPFNKDEVKDDVDQESDEDDDEGGEGEEEEANGTDDE